MIKQEKKEQYFAQQLGKLIQKARKDAGFSQKKLASYLSVSDKAISSYEIGRTMPNLELLGKISKIVNKPLSYFNSNTLVSNVDLQTRLKTVEKELLEIKKLLQKKQ